MFVEEEHIVISVLGCSLADPRHLVLVSYVEVEGTKEQVKSIGTL